MDLALFQYSDTAVMAVRNPDTGAPLLTADGKPVTITLSGRDSAAYEKAEREAIDRRLAEADKSDGALVAAEFMARCTVGWSGVVFDGKEVPCDFDHAVSLYNRLKWLRDQIDAFVASRRNFTKASSKA
jgi:hypothetical protein